MEYCPPVMHSSGIPGASQQGPAVMAAAPTRRRGTL